MMAATNIGRTIPSGRNTTLEFRFFSASTIVTSVTNIGYSCNY